MAQTTHLTSFGPIIVVITLHVAYFVVNNLYIQYILASVIKNLKKLT